ncbi:hypothetical protein [Xanthomonas arboricola]|uniref:hypothetical protein n=1 Tax=Xanthomonas arboricola TaxID=56448 RepID=UPI0011B03348|nr:hypothetical protein [Xanthomonas arboricola]MBB6573539.1 hypothetical protein [Xanthomonas arboricola]
MDIAELGFKVDSSGLVESTRALDQNAAAADKASGSADRLERYFQSMSRSIDRSAVALGDRLGGALERIGVGTGTVITELQGLNHAQAEIVSALVAMESCLTGTAAGAGSNLNFGSNAGSFAGGGWMSFGGGRANGGPVAPGSLYEVGEGGDPELFQQGGRSYLIPGNRGQVVPAAPMASGAQVRVEGWRSTSRSSTRRRGRLRLPRATIEAEWMSRC